MDNIYNDSASFGRFWTYYSAIAISVVSLAVFIAGIMMYRKSDDEFISVEGIVESAVCRKLSSMAYDCNIKVNYMMPNDVNIFSSELHSISNTDYNVGDKVQLMVDSHNVNNVKLSMYDNQKIGRMLMYSSVVMVLFAWTMVWLTRHFQFFASSAGVASVLSIF